MEKRNEKQIKKITVKNSLNGLAGMHTERRITYKDGTKEVQEVDHPLIEISKDNLLKKRKSMHSIFILKNDDKCFFIELPNGVGYMGEDNFALGKHLCFNCKHLSAAEDCNGGCAKVRDIFPMYDKRDPYRWDSLDVKRIEKYDFITLGFETINVVNEDFIVCKCKNYELEKKK